VNVAPAYGLANGTTGLIALGSDDEAGLQAAIGDAGFTANAIEMVVIELENRPGTGAEVMRKLADAGVDLRRGGPGGDERRPPPGRVRGDGRRSAQADPRRLRSASRGSPRRAPGPRSILEPLRAVA
jgi:hypothetical protein